MTTAAKKTTLVVLAATQFLMVLDQAVMNVSISQLVEDFDTSVTAIQGVITLYSLTMAALMLTGAKVGDIIGRRRALVIGMVIYCFGSALTAVSWSVAVLTLGWSILEGIGAALVLPSLAALIAGNFTGKARAGAYAVIGGVAGAGIAIGPILGGWLTTEYTWRLVFAGEVIVGIAILIGSRTVEDAPIEGDKPHLDLLGSLLSVAGMTAVVLGALKAGTWGWVQPKAVPFEIMGLSPTLFLIGGGLAILWAFWRWQAHLTSTGGDPLVHVGLLDRPPVLSGLVSFLSQNLLLMGVFFVIPLYLQLVLGLNALDTGLRMLPVSITMFIFATAGSRLGERYSARTLVRSGFVVILVSSLFLIGAIEPSLDSATFFAGMALLGVGMGLVASQLGNVVQSAVGSSERSEAGGLQYTAQQLGSSLGVALIGTIVIGALVSGFVSNVEEDPVLSAATKNEVQVAVDGGVSFVASSVVADAAEASDQVTPAEADALVAHYEESQLFALKAGLLGAGVIAALALMGTTGLPSRKPGDDGDEPQGSVDEATTAA